MASQILFWFCFFFMVSHFIKWVIIFTITMLRLCEESSYPSRFLCPSDTSTAFLGTWFCFDPRRSPVVTWFTCTPSPVPTPQPVSESPSWSYGQLWLGALTDRDGCGLWHLVWRPWSVGTPGRDLAKWVNGYRICSNHGAQLIQKLLAPGYISQRKV